MLQHKAVRFQQAPLFPVDIDIEIRIFSIEIDQLHAVDGTRGGNQGRVRDGPVGSRMREENQNACHFQNLPPNTTDKQT